MFPREGGLVLSCRSWLGTLGNRSLRPHWGCGRQGCCCGAVTCVFQECLALCRLVPAAPSRLYCAPPAAGCPGMVRICLRLVQMEGTRWTVQMEETQWSLTARQQVRRFLLSEVVCDGPTALLHEGWPLLRRP